MLQNRARCCTVQRQSWVCKKGASVGLLQWQNILLVARANVFLSISVCPPLSSSLPSATTVH